jgi:hypothetical protein
MATDTWTPTRSSVASATCRRLKTHVVADCSGPDSGDTDLLQGLTWRADAGTGVTAAVASAGTAVASAGTAVRADGVWKCLCFRGSEPWYMALTSQEASRIGSKLPGGRNFPATRRPMPVAESAERLYNDERHLKEAVRIIWQTSLRFEANTQVIVMYNEPMLFHQSSQAAGKCHLQDHAPQGAVMPRIARAWLVAVCDLPRVRQEGRTGTYGGRGRRCPLTRTLATASRKVAARLSGYAGRAEQAGASATAASPGLT